MKKNCSLAPGSGFRLSFILKYGLLLAVVTVFLYSCMVMAQEKEAQETHVVILGTSDIHGNICCWSYENNSETAGGMARLYTYIQEVRKENRDAFLIDGGDEIKGTVLTDCIASQNPEKPHPVIEAMNYMGYDSMTLGNHEFDFGVDNMLKMLGTAQFPVLGQNVSDAEGTLLTGTGWTILEHGGIRLAVIGVVTPDVPQLDGDGEGVEKLSFEAAPEAVKKAIAEIGDQADIIMVSAHMGMAGEYDEADGGDSAQEILNENPEIDVLQVGHYHITVNDRQEQTVIGGVKNSGVEIARFDLTLDEDKNITDSEISIIEMKGYQADEGICEIPVVKEAHEAAVNLAKSGLEKNTESETSVPIGFSAAKFQPENEIRGIPEGRLRDTAVIDLILKVELENSGADVASAALYRDTSDLPEGNIYYRNIFDIYKFDNTLYRMTVTGEELKRYMEWSAECYNQWVPGDINISFDPEYPGYLYDMFGGVEYEINLSKPKGERIENLMFRGRPLQDDEVLTLAVNNYRYSSALKAKDLAAGKREWESSNSIRDMIVAYFGQNSPVEPETDNNWRITGVDLSLEDPRREELSYNLADFESLVSLAEENRRNGTGAEEYRFDN